MMAITRWRLDCDGAMEQNPDGEYVRWEDYAPFDEARKDLTTFGICILMRNEDGTIKQIDPARATFDSPALLHLNQMSCSHPKSWVTEEGICGMCGSHGVTRT